MSDREELREVMFESILSPYAAGSDLGLRERDECDVDHAEIEGRLDIGNLAGDLLTAGYRPPARVITTREEADALPVGSVIWDGEAVWLRHDTDWTITGEELVYHTTDIEFPAVVLREGEA